jgi:tRNA intron endonuclease
VGGLIRGSLSEELRVEVRGPEATRLAAQGYGELEGDRLLLWPEEALYLLEKGKMEVEGGGARLGFREYLALITRDKPIVWPRYIIYRDLRESGRVVRKGVGETLLYRLYETSGQETSKYLVFPLSEGESVEVSRLLDAARQSADKGKVLVLAVVERRGEVVYYVCSETSPSNV